jgi:hypothetical protein
MGRSVCRCISNGSTTRLKPPRNDPCNNCQQRRRAGCDPHCNYLSIHDRPLSTYQESARASLLNSKQGRQIVPAVARTVTHAGAWLAVLGWSRAMTTDAASAALGVVAPLQPCVDLPIVLSGAPRRGGGRQWLTFSGRTA